MQYEELTPQEAKLINLWRSTDDRGRRAIMRIAEVNQGWDPSGNFQLFEGTKPKSQKQTN